MYRFPVVHDGYGGGGFDEPDFNFDDIKVPPDDIDDGGGDGPGVILPIWLSASWSHSPSHTFTGSTIVGTTVTLTHGYAPTGWEVQAYASNGATGSWTTVTAGSQSTTMYLTLGTSTSTAYGTSSSITIHVRARGPNAIAQEDIASNSISGSLINKYDTTAPVHGTKYWESGSSFSWGNGASNTISKIAYFSVSDDRAPITSFSVSASRSDGGTISKSITEHSSSNGGRNKTFKVTISVSGYHVSNSSSTTLSTSISTTNEAGRTSSSGSLSGTISKTDQTAPTFSTQIDNVTFSSDNAATTTYEVLNIYTSEAATVTVTGLTTAASNLRYYSVWNPGTNHYAQTIRVPSSHVSPGNSVQHTYRVQVTDLAGNPAASHQDVVLTISHTDASGPSFGNITSPSNHTFNTSNGTSGQSTYKELKWTISDNVGVDWNSITVHKTSGNGVISGYHQGRRSGTNEFWVRVYFYQDHYALGSSGDETESYYITAKDVNLRSGTSAAQTWNVYHRDNVKPSITVQHVDSHTFYTQNNTSNPKSQEQNGFIYWTPSDASSSISSNSASKIGSSDYIKSVTSAPQSANGAYGALYKTQYRIISNVDYGDNFTTRSNLVRLHTSDSAGNSNTKDVDISLKLIDNTVPYYYNPTGDGSANNKIWYTSNGDNQVHTFSGTIDIADQHGSISEWDVTKIEGTFSTINKSKSGNRISFNFNCNSNHSSQIGSNINQAVTQSVLITFKDNATPTKNTRTYTWSVTSKFVDNSPPVVTSSHNNFTDVNFYTSNPQDWTKTIEFQVSDGHSAIQTPVLSPFNYSYYIYTSNLRNEPAGSNTWKYDVRVPVSGKSLTGTTPVDWGNTYVTVTDTSGYSTVFTTHYSGTHRDNTDPVVSNISIDPFNFVDSAGPPSSITKTLSFTASDQHSGINSVSVTGHNGATVSNLSNSVSSYTALVTVSKPTTYADSISSYIRIVATDKHGRSKTVNHNLTGSYADDEGPSIGSISVSGGSTVNFNNTTLAGPYTKTVSCAVADNSGLSHFTVDKISGNGVIGNYTSSLGGSSNTTLSFPITFYRGNYTIESTATEQYRINVVDNSTGTRTSTKSFNITVNYDDTSSPIFSNNTNPLVINFASSEGMINKTVEYTFDVSDTGTGINSVEAFVPPPLDLDPEPGHPFELEPTFEDLLEGIVSCSQPVKVEGTAHTYKVDIVASPGLAGLTPRSIGIITFTAKDSANPKNTASFILDVQAQIADTIGPVLSTGAISNVSLTTTPGTNELKYISISALDVSGLDTTAGGRQVERLKGSGTYSLSLVGNELRLSVVHEQQNYIADNVPRDEEYRVRIKDSVGNWSSWKYLAWTAKLLDNTPPTITLRTAAAFTFNQSSSSEVDAIGYIDITDNRHSINVNSFSVSGDSAHVATTQPSNALTFDPTSGAPNRYKYKLRMKKGSIAGESSKTVNVVLSVKDSYGTAAAGQLTVSHVLTVNDDVAPTISSVNHSTLVPVYSSLNRSANFTISYIVDDATYGDTIPASNVNVVVAQTPPSGITVTPYGTIKNGKLCSTVVNVASTHSHNVAKTIKLQIQATDKASPSNTRYYNLDDIDVKVIDNQAPTITIVNENDNRDIHISNINDTTKTGKAEATFLFSDDLTAAGNLNPNVFGADIEAQSHGSITISKTFTYNASSSPAGIKELKLRVTDAAGQTTTKSVNFNVTQSTHDLVGPQFSNIVVGSGSNEIVMDSNTKANKTFKITATVIDPPGSGSKGVDWNSLRLVDSNGTAITKTTHNALTGYVEFNVTWNYNDNRWKTKYSNYNNGDYVFTETFKIRASDLETYPQVNTSESDNFNVYLKRLDASAPTIVINSVTVNNAPVSTSNPLQLNDSNDTTDEITINFTATDLETAVDNNSFKLQLFTYSPFKSILYSASDGQYNQNTGVGLTVNDKGSGNYEIKMRFKGPAGTPLSELAAAYSTSNFVLLTITGHDVISVTNTRSISQSIWINRVDDSAPSIGSIIDHVGNRNTLQVTREVSTVTHIVKVSVTDAQSGVQSVTMNNGYVAASPSYDSGYYRFTRSYTFDEVWDNQHNSQLVVSGIKVTATDVAGNSVTTPDNQAMTVTVTAPDTQKPDIIVARTDISQINLDTENNKTVNVEFTAVIDDDDYRSNAVQVFAQLKNGTGPTVPLTKGITSQERRTYKGTKTFNISDYSIGSSNVEEWTIYATDANNNQRSADIADDLEIFARDLTKPNIESITIFRNPDNVQVTSATLDIGTGSGFSGYIDVVVSDQHSDVNMNNAEITSSHPNAIQVSTVTTVSSVLKKLRANITINPHTAYNLHGGGLTATTFNVKILDTYNNEKLGSKGFTFTVVDNSNPQISNITGTIPDFEYGAGDTPPAPQDLHISATVTDQPSDGIQSVVAYVNYLSQDRHNVSLSKGIGNTYTGIIRNLDPSILNYGNTAYSIRVRATPKLGNYSEEIKNGLVFKKIDSRGPTLSNAVVKRLSGSVVSSNEVIDINTSDGSVRLKYSVDGEDSHTPLSIVEVTSDIAPSGHTLVNVSETASNVSFEIDYPAADVLALRRATEGDYDAEKSHKIKIKVADSKGNSSEIETNTYKLKVIDNQNPVCIQFIGSNLTKSIGKDQEHEVYLVGIFSDGQSGIKEGSATMSNTLGLPYTITESTNSHGQRVVNVTVTITYNDHLSAAPYNSDTNVSYTISMKDNNNNSVTSGTVTSKTTKIDIVQPEIISYKMLVDGVETNGTTLNETTKPTAIVRLEAEVYDNAPGLSVKLNGISAASSNITPINGYSYGFKHVWEIIVRNTAYEFGNVDQGATYLLELDDGVNTIVSSSKQLYITRVDDIAPYISNVQVSAILLDSDGRETVPPVNIITGNNDLTIRSSPNKSNHRVRLKINANIQENNGFASGHPFVTSHPVLGGWHKSRNNDDFLFYKDINGAQLPLGTHNLQYTIKAKDKAVQPLEDTEDVNINLTIIDNTNPVISNFSASGIPLVNGENIIHLKESESTEVEVVFTLATSDNGAIDEAIVKIVDSVNNIDLTLQPESQGSGSYTFRKTFRYGDFTISNGVESTLTMQAHVKDTVGLTAVSSPILSKLFHTDDQAPNLNYKLYVSRNSNVEIIPENLLFDGDQLVIKSSEDNNNQGILYFKAKFSATDTRGIQSKNVTVSGPAENPSLSLVQHQEDDELYVGSLNYDNIPAYNRAYTYQFTASATDGQDQTATLTKNITISKQDDVGPIATLGPVTGLVDGKLLMRSDRSGDNIITVSVNINENSNAVRANPTLVPLGTGATVERVSFPSGGANGTHNYKITFDKNNYAFTNIADGVHHDQSNVITGGESITFTVADDPNNTPTLIGFPLKFPIEYEDRGLPSVTGITYSATDNIQQGSTNTFTLDINKASKADPPEITVAIDLRDTQTGIDPSSVYLTGINNTSIPFNSATNKAFFTVICNSSFYNNLTLYDQEEAVDFRITFKDKAGNEESHDGVINIIRVDNDDPTIASWTCNGVKEAVITHLDHLPAPSIDAVIRNVVYEERLQRKYYTTTKNGILQAGEVDISEYATISSARPEKGSSAWDDHEDVYVFTLYAIDEGGRTVSDTCKLTVRYEDQTAPTISNIKYTELNGAELDDFVITTEGESDVNAIKREILYKADLADFTDRKDQLDITLIESDNFTDSVVTNKQRMVSDEGENQVIFKLELTTGGHLTSLLQPITMRLKVKDRSGNERAQNATINVRIDDNQGPVIWKVESDIIGDSASYQNHVLANLGNLGYKRVTHQLKIHVYDESEININRASMLIRDDQGEDYTLVSCVLNGKEQGSPNYLIIATKERSYDESRFILGQNYIGMEIQVEDLGTPANKSNLYKLEDRSNDGGSDNRQNLYKEDQVPPAIYGYGCYDSTLTSVIDSAWTSDNLLISTSTSAQIDVNALKLAVIDNAMIVMKAKVVTSSNDQALLEVGGETNAFFAGIVGGNFIASVGDNSGNALRNNNAKISFDIGEPNIANNPLANKLDSDELAEIAFLVRKDKGLLMMYVDGKLCAAAEARERSYSAWGDNANAVCNFGGLVSDARKRNKDGPDVSGSLSNYDWVGDLDSIKVYKWTSTNNIKHIAEASNHRKIVDENNQVYNGEIRLAVLDNELGQTLTFKKNNNVVDANNGRSSIINGIVTAPVQINYQQQQGTTESNLVYKVNARQMQNIGTHKNTPLMSGEQTLTIISENRDVVAPVVTEIIITKESDDSVIQENGQPINLSSSTDVDLIIEVKGTDNSGPIDSSSSNVGFLDSISMSVEGSLTRPISETFTEQMNPIANEPFKRRFKAKWSDFFSSSDPLNGNGDYILTVTAKVRDAAGNVSVPFPRTVTFRTNDNSPPTITNVTCKTADSFTGSFGNNDLQAVITLNSSDAEKNVEFKIDHSDNNYRSRGTITTTKTGPVYSGSIPQPAPNARSVWSVSQSLDDGVGNYSTVMRATYKYNDLKQKNDYQYRFGDDGNIETITFAVSDPHGNADEVTVKVKIIMVDNEAPSIPQCSIINKDTTALVSSILLTPQSGTINLLVNVSASDYSDIHKSNVIVTATPVGGGVNDVNGYIEEIVETTGDFTYTNNFQANLPLSYDKITRAFGEDVTYKFAVTVEDVYGNHRTNNNAATLVIQRQDNDPPSITLVKRNQHSVLHKMFDAGSLNRYDGNVYNNANVDVNGASAHDLLFEITDNDAVRNLYIKRSEYIITSATNPVIPNPVYEDTAIALLNKGNNRYEPGAVLVHDFDQLSETAENKGFSRSGTNMVYYQFWKVHAEDPAGNIKETVIPFKVNKVDDIAPGNISVSLKNISIKDDSIVAEDNQYNAHAEGHPYEIEILSAVDLVRVAFRVSASDNDEIDKVALLQNPNDDITNELGFDGTRYTTSREYLFNSDDGFGSRLVETLHVVVVDKSGNRGIHTIPVYIQQVDVTKPNISVVITESTGQTSGNTELQYPGDTIQLFADAEITDSGAGVDETSVELVTPGSDSDWVYEGITNGKFRWSKTISHGAPFGEKQANIKVRASDKAPVPNTHEVAAATFHYRISFNLNMDIIGTFVDITPENGAKRRATGVLAHAIDPSTKHTAEYSFVVKDPTNLIINQGDSSIKYNNGDATGVATITNVRKSAVNGNDQTFTITVAFDSADLVKGDNDANEISIDITITDGYGQTKDASLSQKYYVWNYVTQEETPYYYIYKVDLNALINKVEDGQGNVVGYQLPMTAYDMRGRERLEVNLPTGNLPNVVLEPFIVQKMVAGTTDQVEDVHSFAVNTNIIAESTGAVDGQVFVQDKEVIISYADDEAMAQVIYSNYDQTTYLDGLPDPLTTESPEVTPLTADILSRKIDRNYLYSHPFARAQLNERVASLLRTDAPPVTLITLSEIPTGSTLDQIAQRNGTFGNNSILHSGQRFVLNTTVPYHINVIDYNGTTHRLVSKPDGTPYQVSLILQQS